MSYVALYRKFRPATFDEVRGQDHIVTTLKNQINNGRIGHAYLFCGTRGTGKTSIAKIFAKAVNCAHPRDGSPCGECESCKAIADGGNMNVIEIDAASNNGVDHIREIIEEVSYPPVAGKKKVYIIDEVHMLSGGAFNALLKTLEEPPEYVIFILATTEVQKIPVTILSRCQRYDFHRITTKVVLGRLQEVVEAERIEADEEALYLIARAADGSMRDGLSLLDQCVAFLCGEKLTGERVRKIIGAVDTEIYGRFYSHLLKGEVTEAIDLIADIVYQGGELLQFVRDFVWYLRNLMLSKTAEELEDVIDVSPDHLEELRRQAAEAQMETLLLYIRLFSELSSEMRYSTQKRVLLEMTVIKVCHPESEMAGEALAERLRVLERETQELRKRLDEGSAASVAYAMQENPPSKSTLVEKAVEVEEATEEDLQEMAASWGQYLGEMSPALRALFSPKNFDRVEVKNRRLCFLFTNRNVARMLEGECGRSLQEFLTERTGKKPALEGKTRGGAPDGASPEGEKEGTAVQEGRDPDTDGPLAAGLTSIGMDVQMTES